MIQPIQLVFDAMGYKGKELEGFGQQIHLIAIAENLSFLEFPVKIKELFQIDSISSGTTCTT